MSNEPLFTKKQKNWHTVIFVALFVPGILLMLGNSAVLDGLGITSCWTAIYLQSAWQSLGNKHRMTAIILISLFIGCLFYIAGWRYNSAFLLPSVVAYIAPFVLIRIRARQKKIGKERQQPSSI
jgi:hypothetical protein